MVWRQRAMSCATLFFHRAHTQEPHDLVFSNMKLTVADIIYTICIGVQLPILATLTAIWLMGNQPIEMWHLWLSGGMVGLSAWTVLMGLVLAVAKIFRRRGLSIIVIVATFPVAIGLGIGNYILFFLLMGFTGSG